MKPRCKIIVTGGHGKLMEISIVNNMIHFMREGEIGTISAIKEGCI